MKENKKINKKPRTVGFEYEYSDLSPNQVSKIIQDIWGGQLTKKHETFYEVQNTRVGNFTIELDAEDIQKITAKSAKIQHKKQPKLIG